MTEARYFVEERQFDGGWKPAVYHGSEPLEKTPGGKRRTFRAAPVLIPTCHHKLNLGQLAEVYGVDGQDQTTRK